MRMSYREALSDGVSAISITLPRPRDRRATERDRLGLGADPDVTEDRAALDTG
jgi:hypothetical protein